MGDTDAVEIEALLELLNSTPVVDARPTDLLGDDDAARRWAITHGGVGSRSELVGLRDVRDRLQAVVRGEAEPAVLDAAVGHVRLAPRPHAGGIDWHLDAADDARLAARLVLAWGRTCGEMPGRLRPCANDECRLFLLDRSRAGTARWCSMKACGNRLKARRHQQRHPGG